MFLLGDFNVDFMHYNEHKPTNEFLDSLACRMQVIQEPLLTIFSVILSQKTLFVVILQIPFLSI